MHQNMHQLADESAVPPAPHAGAHHGHADAAPSGDELPSAQELPATDGDAAHSCSACSPFCIGAVAPPPGLIAPPPPGGSETVIPSPAPLIAGFIPDAQKRPPRHISA
ncbi:MAG TPA: hypothetical protein VFT37_12165 [Telluria sp.]|nr:hypothetical protein [Telluria sp.]